MSTSAARAAGLAVLSSVISREKPMRKQHYSRLALVRGACRAAGRGAHHPDRDRTARTESPTFGGYSWPGVGQYEKIVGKALRRGRSAPIRKNAVIVDIELAPRNARGNVEYSFDFYILKPIDLTKGAHKVMYEPPNRGGKTWGALGRVLGPAATIRARSPIRRCWRTRS